MQRRLDDLGIPLCDVSFCVVDLETTGSDRATDLITEIGAVKVRGGECLGTFHTLVNPGRAVPPSITVLTGITDALLVPAPRIEQVLPSFLEFSRGCVIVGHNVRFDLAFLDSALGRTGRSRITAPHIDTLALARRLVRDDVPNCRLDTLAERFRLDHRPRHRALDDALATTDLLHVLLERAASYGVLGLDDLLALPRLGGHPQVAKLRMTHDMPRGPGVYMFVDGRGEVLYVGKATNLRQRVRSYFGSDDRRKVGPMLRETQSVSHVSTPDLLSAEVLELRYIHALSPRYNRAGTTWGKYSYVRLTDEPWPRLVVVKDPAPTGVHLGPLPSRAMAQLVVEAVQSAVPLRRCAARLRRDHTAALDAVACAPAQLGVASCPCAGLADPRQYAGWVAEASRAITADPTAVLDMLHARMLTLAGQQRFEEAALVRDRASALATAVTRHRRVDGLRRAGRVTLAIEPGQRRRDRGGVIVELDHGVVVDVRADGQLTAALPLPGEPPGPVDRPVPRRCVDELLCVARYLDTHAGHVRVLACDGAWEWPCDQVSWPLPAAA